MELTKLIELLHKEIKHADEVAECCAQDKNDEGKSAWLSRGNALRDFAVRIIENID